MTTGFLNAFLSSFPARSNADFKFLGIGFLCSVGLNPLLMKNLLGQNFGRIFFPRFLESKVQFDPKNLESGLNLASLLFAMSIYS